MTGKTILITGVDGFIGSALARELASVNVVAGVGTRPYGRWSGLAAYQAMRLPHPDFTDFLAATRPDVLIHCAGGASVSQSLAAPRNDHKNGPMLVAAMLDAVRRTGLSPLFVFPSSAAVYGNPAVLPVREDSPIAPISPYGEHKAESERLILERHRQTGLPYLILRIFSCYGPRLRKQLLWDVSNKIMAGQLELFGTGDETRDVRHVRDLARLVSRLAEGSVANAILNVAAGRQTPVRVVVDLLRQALGRRATPAYNGKNRPGDPLYWEADVARMGALGVVPAISLEEGVAEYARWFLQDRARSAAGPQPYDPSPLAETVPGETLVSTRGRLTPISKSLAEI